VKTKQGIAVGLIGAFLVCLALKNPIVTLIVLVLSLLPLAVWLMVLAGEADSAEAREKYNRD
jgi:heme A synthase